VFLTRTSILASALALLLAGIALCPAATADSSSGPVGTPTPLTPERAVKSRRISDLLLAPGGQSAVCVVSEVNGPQPESHLWLVDVKGGGLRQLTDSPKGDRSPEWSPRGDSVAFLSNRTDPTQVYVIPRNGGEAHAVTHSPTRVHLFRWSPDGTQIAYLAREPDPSQGVNAPHVADRPEDVERLWVVDVSTGITRRLTDGTLRIDEFGWSAPDRLLAVASDRPADETWTTALYDIGVATPGVVRAIGHPRQPFGELTFSPNRQQFGFLSTDHEGPIPHDLFLQHVGDTSARNVTTAIDRKVTEIHWQDNSNVFVRVADGFYYRIARIDPKGTAHWIALPHSVRAFDVAHDGTLIFVGVGFNQLPEVFLRHTDGKVVQLGELQDHGWTGVRLNDAEIFKFKSFDGTLIEAALMKPHSAAAAPATAKTPAAVDGAPSAKAPLIVLAHGGPASSFMSDYFWFNAWPQLLVTHGYQVLLVNPRGSIGYGEQFEKANRADLGGGDFKDLMAATDAVIARGEVDPDRLGIGGWSYGAEMTQWAIGHTNRFKAAVSGQGVFDEAFEFYTEDGPAADEWYFGTPWEHPDIYARNSPATFIGNARTPTLIMHMEGDVTNPLSQSQGLYRALKHLGVEAELVTYAEDAHLPRQEQFQIDVMKRMIDWYDRHLK
jgi:dipeptidyl aminopeptidase/acylaminoacyl peptidase